MIRNTTVAFFALAGLSIAAAAARADFEIGDIRLPPGFEIEEYVSGVRNARGLAIGENGTR